MAALPDYYQILGVRREADHQELIRAYRREAMRCHPDHGGSHEAMLRLNEAWEILRNSESRREYDEWLKQQGAQSVAITTAVQRARTTASNYPRRWTDFEKWMNRIFDDFTNAEYGTAEEGIPVPTAKNSVSGTLIILVGCVVGLVVGGMIFLTFNNTPLEIVARLLVFVFIVLGGMAGKAIHKAMGSGITAARARVHRRTPPHQPHRSTPPPIPTTNSESAQKIKITCPHCSQRIEASAEVIGTVVTCPTCQKNFHVGKRTPQPPPIP
jgi:hypothetical protein